MTSMPIPTTRRPSDARERLHQGVAKSVRRGRLLALLGVALLGASAVVGGLFVVCLIDAAVVLPVLARGSLLVVLLFASFGTGLVFALRSWLSKRMQRAAGEAIDHAAGASQQQPVTLGLSLRGPIGDDTLALRLLERAESRAAGVAQSVKPGVAYPFNRLRRQGRWLMLAAGLWLLLAIVVPSQVVAMFSRVAVPWGGAPPFSLTQLDPAWTPRPPDAGDDVVVSVEPAGLTPESVDWVRVNAQGNEAERFAMTADGRGGFTHRLRRVETPIRFQLETHGRHTRVYIIAPTPRPPVAGEHGGQDPDRLMADNTGGATQYDPEKIAQRDLDAHHDWPALKDKLHKLMGDLADAQAAAESLDAADTAAIKALSDQLAKLTKEAEQLAGELAAIQGELPAEAASVLAELQTALTSMQSAALPAPPGSADSAASPSGASDPTPVQWLEQAADAARADQQSIGRGLGPSDRPTDSGSGSGQSGDGPDTRDPGTSGSYDELAGSGDAGPLPDTVMRQVPPRYRLFVAKYFQQLADEPAQP